LNARDEDLLRQLVELHTTAGRPIGSEGSSRKGTGGGGLSPSSIRNAMAKLKRRVTCLSATLLAGASLQ